MKSVLALAITCLALLALFGGLARAQDAGSVQSLRGAQVDEPVSVAGVPKQEKQRFQRNYRQQPPLIPHGIEQYQIDTNANQCLACHDWSNAGDRQAPDPFHDTLSGPQRAADGPRRRDALVLYPMPCAAGKRRAIGDQHFRALCCALKSREGRNDGQQHR